MNSINNINDINYITDNHFILHQPFFHDDVMDYNEIMYTEPYQALYYEFRTNAREEQCTTYIPSGCMDLIFIQTSSGNYVELLGSSVEAKQIKRIPCAKYFGVRFKPGMFLSYGSLSLRDIANQELFFDCTKYEGSGNEACDLLNEEFIHFFHMLSKTDLLNRKIELFHKYFDEYIDVSEVNDLTGYILSEINSTQGNVRIHELADELHYSERHLSRIFLDSMGITPKTFARIVRFQNAMDSILHEPKLTLCDYMCELGYSDQAHFQREFKQYTGVTPRRFINYAQNCNFTFRCVDHNTQMMAG